MKDAQRVVVEKITDNLQRIGSLKVSTTLLCKFENSKNGETIEENKSFKSGPTGILPETNLDDWFTENVCKTLLKKLKSLMKKIPVGLK